MAEEYRLDPNPAVLAESLRSIGYSFETAVADLLDNSITAGATLIEILTLPAYFSVTDNGHGMRKDELIEALRHGTAGPEGKREEGSLGRFGLGLKTASFSQCRELTVLSSVEGGCSGARWDLDLVKERNQWLITTLDENEITKMLSDLSLELGRTGTIVIWRKLDRLLGMSHGQKRQELVNEKAVQAEQHLSLVFHRFLNGKFKGRKKIKITINGHQVKPFDPFCIKHSETQKLPQETVSIEQSKIKIKPYILPHYSKLSEEEYQQYNSRSAFLSNQGVYIYRGGRLMTWGKWFGLTAKSEKTKMARVQIDFSSALDNYWKIDIKKSQAKPPSSVKERLKQIMDTIENKSTKLHSGRGNKLFSKEYQLWERIPSRGGIAYGVNKSHPLIKCLIDNLEDRGKKTSI